MSGQSIPEKLGRTLAAGWSDQVFVGVLMGYLEGVSCQRCHKYIRENKDLMTWVSEKRWRMLRRMANEAKITAVTGKEVITELRKRRPDLVDILRNHPDGMPWLNRQIAVLKEKLLSPA